MQVIEPLFLSLSVNGGDSLFQRIVVMMEEIPPIKHLACNINDSLVLQVSLLLCFYYNY